MCRTNYKGIWTLGLLLLLVYFVGSNLEFDNYVCVQLGVPEATGNSPLYFVRRDFVQGISNGLAAFLGMTLALATWRRCQPFSGWCLWMSWLWFMPKVVRAAIIYWQCPWVLDPNRAVSPWPTLHAYLYDPLGRAAFWATLAATAPFVYLALRAQKLANCGSSSAEGTPGNAWS